MFKKNTDKILENLEKPICKMWEEKENSVMENRFMELEKENEYLKTEIRRIAKLMGYLVDALGYKFVDA